jgi:hypothetical protein
MHQVRASTAIRRRGFAPARVTGRGKEMAVVEIVWQDGMTFDCMASRASEVFDQYAEGGELEMAVTTTEKKPYVRPVLTRREKLGAVVAVPFSGKLT